MRRLDKEITDNKIIEEIITKSQVVRVAFSIDNVPHIVPLSYGYHDNKLYIHSAPEGTKIELIKQNNYVCFEMELSSEIVKAESPCNWTTKYRSLIGWGTISIVNNNQEKIKGLDVIMEKFGGNKSNTYNQSQLDKMILLVIEIEKMTGKQSGKW